MNKQKTFPWSDCKVAYDINDVDAFEWWWDNADTSKILPTGWRLMELDGSGARYVAIFRVNVGLTISDGEKVLKILKKFN